MKNPRYRPKYLAPFDPYESIPLALELTGWLEDCVPEQAPGYRFINMSHEETGPCYAVGYFNNNRRCRAILIYWDNPPRDYGSAGTTYIFVAPGYRGRGIGINLLRIGIELFDIRVENQIYTNCGARLTNRFVEEKLRELGEL